MCGGANGSLLEFLRSPDDDALIMPALEAIAKQKNPASIPTLVEYLESGQLNRARAAAAALAEMKWEPTGHEAALAAGRQDWQACVRLGKAAVPYLLRAAVEPDSRQGACSALVTIGDESVMELLLTDLQHRETRENAALLLSTLGLPAVPPLVRALWQPDYSHLKQSIVLVLGAIAKKYEDKSVRQLVLEQLLRQVCEGEAEVRQTCSQLLGNLFECMSSPDARSQIVAALQLAMQDRDARVCQAAASGLARCGSEAETALVELLTLILRKEAGFQFRETGHDVGTCQRRSRQCVISAA